MVSFQWGAAEYFTVMDVPHGDLVSDAFGARRGWVLSGVGRGSLCPTAFSTVEKCRGDCGFLKRLIHLGKGMIERWRRGVSPESFYFCSLCSKECSKNGKLGLPGLPLHSLSHNGCNILTKLSCITNLYISRSCKHLKRNTF